MAKYKKSFNRSIEANLICAKNVASNEGTCRGDSGECDYFFNLFFYRKSTFAFIQYLSFRYIYLQRKFELGFH